MSTLASCEVRLRTSSEFGLNKGAVTAIIASATLGCHYERYIEEGCGNVISLKAISLQYSRITDDKLQQAP
jgi:hypothetical protein